MTLQEVQSVITEIKHLIEKDFDATTYNWLVKELNYYKRLETKLVNA